VVALPVIGSGRLSMLSRLGIGIGSSGQRQRWPLLIGILAILALLPAFLFYNWLAPEAEASWFDTSYSFRQRVPVGNSSGENKTDFQVKITLDTASLIASGKLQSECQDVRFTNINGQVLPYWIEPNTCNTSETLVWTKVPSIPTDGTDLYFYYGNPSANSTADTQKVFIRDMESAAAAWPMQEEASTTLSYAEAKHPSDSEGRDIVINGNFSNWTGDDPDSWTVIGEDGVNNQITENSGQVRLISDGTLIGIRQDVISVGKAYEISIEVTDISSGGIKVFVASTQVGNSITTTGTHTIEFTVGSTAALYIYRNTGTTDVSFDNVEVRQVDISSSGDFDGSEFSIDGDMEAVDTNAWSSYADGTFSKETGDPHGGLRVLRTFSDNNDHIAGARQPILSRGKTYYVTGYVRSDGVVTPTLTTEGSTNVFWTGTTSTSWQYFNAYVHTTSPYFTLRVVGGTLANYAEWDDISVTEISPLSGSIPTDNSTNRPTLGADSSSGHLSNAYTFDGSNDYVNIYSSDLNSVFNPDEGTLVVWAKVSGAGVWEDGTERGIVYLGSDSNNLIKIVRRALDNQIFVIRLADGLGTNEQIATSTTGWFMVAVTWDTNTDEFKVFFNGTQDGSTQNGLTPWTGNLSNTLTLIGANSTTPSNPWSGDINDVRLYSRALSADEIADLYSASTDIQAYYTDNYEGRELIRKYDDDNITVGSLGTEEVGPGPVAYWKFDEGADNTCPGGEDVCDSTKNGNDGTFTGSPRWQSEDMCINGKCLYFDGSAGNYATVTKSGSLDFSTEGYSLSAWVKYQGAESTQARFIGDRDGADSGLVCGVDADNQFECIIEGSTSRTIDGGISNDNRWHHFSFVRNSGDTIKLYIDGHEVDSQIDDMGDISNSINWAIGRHPTGGQDWTGFIDEVKIYPYARTEAQIKADYNQFAAVLGLADQGNLSDGLVGYWSMDESSGTTVADKSGNGNNGTLTNAQENGTSDGSGNSTTTLVDTDGTLSSTDDAYNGMVLSITDDATCPLSADAERIISDYDGTTKTFTVGAAFSAAPNTCNYTILHQVGGKFGNGVAFDNANDYVSVSNNISLTTQATWSFWYSSSTFGDGTNMIIDKYLASGTDRSYRIAESSNNTATVQHSNDGTNYQTSTSGTNFFENSGWHLATITYNNGTFNFYSDGIYHSQATGYSSLNNPTVVTEIGRQMSGMTSYYGGYLDEVRIYNRALSPSEVKQLYQWAPGPVGYWDFNEGSGDTAFDKSGNGLNGTISNAVYTTGKYGSALGNPVNDTMETATIANNSLFRFNDTQSFSYGGWVKIDGSDSTGFIIRTGSNNTSTPGYTLLIPSSNFARCSYSDGDGLGADNVTGTTDIADGNWHHVVCAMDRNGFISGSPGFHVFVDGKVEGSNTSLTEASASHTTNNLSLGDFHLSYEYYGALDEVKIYNYARTAEQIRQDMAGTASPGVSSGAQLPQPVAHWRFDEQSGQTAHDSIADNDGMLGADASVGSDDPTWKASNECVKNGCLDFSASEDVYLNIQNTGDINFSSEDFSILGWINPTTLTQTNARLISFGQYLSAGYEVFVDNNARIKFRTYQLNQSQESRSQSSLQTGRWQHFAVIRSGSTTTFYLDGKNITEYSGEHIDPSSYLGELRLGKYVSSYAFNGVADEVKIFNSALTAEQIRLDMNSGSPLVFGGSGEVSEAADLTDGAGNPPVAEWRFDEKTGSTAYDTSGNGNDGSITGATWTSGCKQGVCLEFNGENSVVNLPLIPAVTINGTYTFNAWVKLNGFGTGNATIFRNHHNSDTDRNGITITSTGNLISTAYDGSYHPVSRTFPLDDEWHYITVVSNSGSRDIYIDGQPGPQGVSNAYVGANGAAIGASDNQDHWFKGLIDHVKIYDYARTPAQITYDYNRGEPIAHYKFDECEGNTVHDSSDNENHGTLTVTTSGGNTAGIGTCSVDNSAWGSGSEGKFGSSLNFDGDGDYVDIYSTGFNTNFSGDRGSISLWAKVSDAGVWSDDTVRRMLYFQVDPDNLFVFQKLGTNDIELRREAGTVRSGETISITNTDWVMYTLTWDASSDEVKAYVNGLQRGATDNSLGTWSGNLSPSTTVLGASSTSGTNSWSGQIDDVRIYNYALSPAQVRKLYNGGAAIRFGE
jgi:hypothetical protein